MEFLMLLLLAVSLFIVWRKPEKEKWAWRLFLASTAVCVFLFLLDVHTAVFQMGNL